jgi:cytochrome c oxidase subunit 2
VQDRRPPYKNPIALGLLVLLVLAALVIWTPFPGAMSPESGASPNAVEIRELYDLIMALAVIVFVGVEVALIYMLVRYRARKGAVASQIHGNTRLEVAWTVIPALILVFLVVFTFIQLDDIKNPAASDIDRNGNPTASSNGILYATTDQPNPPEGSASLRIKVDGQQYVWRYQYPGPDDVFAYTEMVVPVGMTVILDISADDVQHAWWIPKLGGKMDALPGYTNRTWFKVDKAGEYPGQCAELCGRGHANMFATVKAVPFPEYRRWYSGQAARIKTAREEAAKAREQTFGGETETTETEEAQAP